MGPASPTRGICWNPAKVAGRPIPDRRAHCGTIDYLYVTASVAAIIQLGRWGCSRTRATDPTGPAMRASAIPAHLPASERVSARNCAHAAIHNALIQRALQEASRRVWVRSWNSAPVPPTFFSTLFRGLLNSSHSAAIFYPKNLKPRKATETHQKPRKANSNPPKATEAKRQRVAGHQSPSRSTRPRAARTPRHILPRPTPGR